MPGIGQKRIALIALGSNLPFEGLAGAALLDAAVAALESEGMSPIARSSVLANPALSPGQPDYVNAVLAAEVGVLEPQAVLSTLLKMERRFGRERGERWAARTLDLDLLDLDGLILDEPGLALPHPRLHERGFVLGPLAEIAPDWVHPRLGATAAALLARFEAAHGR